MASLRSRRRRENKTTGGKLNISLHRSQHLVTVQADRDTNIWVAPNGDVGRATQLTSVSSELDGSIGVAWTPDGKIVYYSMTAGKEGIWIMEADGKNRKQLTTGETVDFFPSVSPDGRYIVFASDRTGQRNIWRMDIDGSNPKRLTDRGNYPQATAEWVVYSVGRGTRLWKVPIDGGEPEQLGENMSWSAVSPDGKLIACVLNKTGQVFGNDLAVLPIEGGAPVKVFDANLRPPGVFVGPGRRAVTYLRSRRYFRPGVSLTKRTKKLTTASRCHISSIVTLTNSSSLTALHNVVLIITQIMPIILSKPHHRRPAVDRVVCTTARHFDATREWLCLHYAALMGHSTFTDRCTSCDWRNQTRCSERDVVPKKLSQIGHTPKAIVASLVSIEHIGAGGRLEPHWV